MKRLINKFKRLFCQTDVVRSLPDIYSGELNTERIKEYRKLKDLYNVEEGTIRDIFCSGADWYKKVQGQ